MVFSITVYQKKIDQNKIFHDNYWSVSGIQQNKTHINILSSGLQRYQT